MHSVPCSLFLLLLLFHYRLVRESARLSSPQAFLAPTLAGILSRTTFCLKISTGNLLPVPVQLTSLTRSEQEQEQEKGMTVASWTLGWREVEPMDLTFEDEDEDDPSFGLGS